MDKRRFLQTALAALPAACAFPRVAVAAPESTTIVVGFAAGGGLDALTRLIAQRLQARGGRPVIVDNRAGASGQLAVQALKKGAPDGSLLMTAPFAVPVMNPAIFNLKDQTAGVDYLPVALLATFEFALAVRADHPARDWPSFVAWMKSDPRHAIFGSAAVGNLPHYLGLHLGRTIGVTTTAAGYKGAGALLPDLMGGHLPFAISAENDFLEMVRAGRLRLLMTFGERRSASSPAVPTARELGLDLTASGWYGLYAPAGSPPAVIAETGNAVRALLAEPDTKERIARMGLVARADVDAAALGRLTDAARSRWEPVIRRYGVKAD